MNRDANEIKGCISDLKARLEQRWAGHTSGPQTPGDLEEWPAQLLSHLDSFQRSQLLQFLRHAHSYSTGYSGCGFFESAIGQMSAHLGVRPPKCTEAWELLPKPRAALLCSSPESPQHVFGDMLSICPLAKVKKMRRIQRVLANEHLREMQRDPSGQARSIAERGGMLFDALDGLLAGLEPLSSSWCYKHRRMCLFPVVPPEHFAFHCSGSTCVDYSCRSRKRLRELGSNTVVFCAWAKMRQWRCEELILHECVCSHPSLRFMQRYLGSTHFMWTWVMCPSIQGHPTTRRRRFLIALHQGRVKTPLCRGPRELFHRDIVADGSLYWSAPAYQVDAWLGANSARTCREALPRGAQQRRFQH